MGLFNRNTGNLIPSNSSGSSVAQRLAKAAGRLIGSAAATTEQVEQLEKRELLFNMTITAGDVDQATGLGTIRAYVHYALPRIFDDGEYDVPLPTGLTEDFNDEGFGLIGNGQLLLGSNIQVQHNVTPAGDLQVLGIPLQQDNQARFVRADLNQNGERFAFLPRGVNAQTGEATANRAADSVQFQVQADAFSAGDTSGIDTNNASLELLDVNGAVIRTFTGAALRRLFFTPADGNVANQANTNAPRGVGTIVIDRFQGQPDQPPAFAPFYSVRLTSTGTFSLGDASAFNLDNLVFGITAGRFTALSEEQEFGFVAVLSGPVGASASFTDLAGNPMVRDSFLGVPEGGNLSGFDPDDDGQVNTNFGLRSIRFNNVDARTSFTMWGTRWEAATERAPGADDFFGNANVTIIDSVTGVFDDFENLGFGYAADPVNDNVEISGLPPGAGSVVVGSPFLRSGVAGPALPGQFVADPTASPDFNFNRPDQGLFVPTGQSIGSVNIHG
ncbi:MAG: hypothetical protein ACK5P8_01735, partial [Phycisphaerae bacterium]